MDIEPVRKILDSTAFIYNCFFTAVLTLGVLTFLLWPEPKRFYIGESTWADCWGGVLPDQVEVPEPEPMP